MLRIALLISLLALAACGSDNNVAAPNNTSGNNTSNTSGSNNATNNATSGTNNATSGTNNATSGTNNTMGTNNTTPTNNTNGGMCTPLDPALGDCDPLCQTGCEPGEHCILDADTTAACGPSGVGAQGQACNADTECAVGLHCRSVAGSAPRCLNYCNPDGEPGCPANHACVRLQADTRVGACVPIENECDAAPTDTCTDPDECYDTIQGRKCLPSGDVMLDGDCNLSSECAAGLRCVSIMDVGQVCKPLCDPNGAADQCTDGMCRTLQSPQGEQLTWGACY